MNKYRLDKLIIVVFMVTIAFTALAHGAVQSWSVAVFELIVLLLMLLWTIKFVVNKKIEIKIPLTALPIGAFLLFGIIQSIALTNSNGQISSVSYDVEATRYTVKILFFLLVSHIIAFNIFNSLERIRMLINFLTVFGLILAIFGLVQYFTWNGNLYWIIPAGGDFKGVIGPFVNHNHFAGYLELLIPLPIALVLTGATKQTRILYGFAAVMMAIAAIGSLSRGGIISLTAGLLFTVLVGINFAFRRKKFLNNKLKTVSDLTQSNSYQSIFRNLGIVALIIGAIILGTTWIGLDPVVDRLSKNSIVSSDENGQTFEDARGWIWKNSWTMFAKNPIYGVGMGAFETTFPNYSDDYGGSHVITPAHNDYLQVLTDTGVIGGGIALWFILTLLFIIGRGLALIEPFQSGIIIGCSAAIVSLLIHSIFDFNLQIISTSLLFLILTSILTAVSSLNKEQKLNCQ